MSEARRPPTTDGDSTAAGEPSRRDEEDGPSLLARAGVIGASAIRAGDRGNPFIPVSGPSTAATQPAASGAGTDADADAEVDTETAAEGWAESGIPEAEIEHWQRVGATPTTATTLRRLGASPDAVGAAPVSADDLVGWLWHGFAPEEVATWLASGSVRAAVRRRDAGLPPGGAEPR